MDERLLKYIGILLLFGTNGIIAAAIALPSQEIVLLRTLIGSILLAIVFLAGGGRFSLHRLPRSLAYTAVSGTSLSGCWLCLYQAYREIGVGVTSLFYALGPVLVIAAAPLLFREHLSPKSLAGFAVVIAGAILISGGALTGSLTVAGVLLGLGSALFYALMVVFCKKAREAEAAPVRAADAPAGEGPRNPVRRVDSLEYTVVQLASACLVTTAAIAAMGVPVRMPAASDAVPVLVLGCVNTGFGCLVYFKLINELPAQTVAVCGYLEPLSSLLFAIPFLGEIPTAAQAIGCVLILAGAVYSEKSRYADAGENRRILPRSADDERPPMQAAGAPKPAAGGTDRPPKKRLEEIG